MGAVGDEVMYVAGDLRDAAARVHVAFAGVLGDAWERRAAPTDWSCRGTLDHLCNALCGYAASLANRRTQRRRHHPRNGDPTAAPPDLLELVVEFAGLLAAVAEGASRHDRGIHPAGTADRDGFVAMGCDELLVHGHDIAASVGVAFEPPAGIAGRVVARLFPWAPSTGDRWQTLLWANGRAAVDGLAPPGADWWWHCAPLAEWDGEPRRRRAGEPPGWP
jgi:hypothetical protein